MTQISRSKWFVISFAILLAANIVLVFMLVRLTDKPTERKGTSFVQMVKELKLDSAQQQIFRHRKDSFMKSMKPLWDDIRRSKYDLYRQLQDVNTPDSVIHTLAEAIGQKTMVSEEMQFKHFRELRVLCTPEQQVRFDTLVPHWMSRYRNKPQSRTTQSH